MLLRQDESADRITLGEEFFLFGIDLCCLRLNLALLLVHESFLKELASLAVLLIERDQRVVDLFALCLECFDIKLLGFLLL
ncbi:MAG: hypothetical protein Q7R81_02750 [Candidatus Peregrinibacteria bacterium]|nr:hypothetical protein [Candidatus Peregrinibacteria bacterium]